MTGNLSEAAVVSLPCLDVPRSETKLPPSYGQCNAVVVCLDV